MFIPFSLEKSSIDMLQTIQQAVKVHDKYQIEIKLDYELLEGKKTAYNVIRYTKEIILNNPQAFSRTFADMKITGINDIFRYDIQAYLNKMADPVQEKLYLNEKLLTTIPAHKVYHLNLVSKYRSLVPQKEKIYKRIRLILNREGIKRIEHISL